MKDENTHFPKECFMNRAKTCYTCSYSYTACIQSRFPDTLTAVFEDKTGQGELGFLRTKDNKRGLIIQRTENSPLIEKENIGTQQPASGDSGSGHWMENGRRSVLVGITTGGVIAGPQQMQKTTHLEIWAFIRNRIMY